MMITDFTGLDFDDVYLLPSISNINSRTEVDLSVSLGNLQLEIPIIASPMEGLVGVQLIRTLSELGGIGILHRFHKSDSEWRRDVNYLSNECENFGVAVGLNDDLEKVKYALDKGAKIICVDIANGYLLALHYYCEEVSNYRVKYGYGTQLMTGNVVSWNGVRMLHDSGVNMVRCGIGSGALCTTRLTTGIGKPQLQTIHDCSFLEFYAPEVRVENKRKSASDLGVAIVADGGLYAGGDLVKALAAGADFLMIGSAFAETYESDNNGQIHGMASKFHQEEHYHEVRSVEGITKDVEKNKSLESLITNWSWNIKSACTYMNARNLKELRENAIFIKARA